MSYPLIAGGRVFVTVANTATGTSPNYGSTLYALDETTGTTLWSVALGGTYYWSAAAYDNGKVFAVNDSGLLSAFDAATGSQDWVAQMPGQYSFSSPPIAVNGVVYLGGAGSGGTVYAVDETTGTVKWTAPVANGDDSSPAYGGTDVYVSYSCPQVYAFDAVAGTQQWHYSGPCEGGGGSTPVYANGNLYVKDFTGNSGYVFNGVTGALTGSFGGNFAPSFSGSARVTLNNGAVSAQASNGTNLWSFAGDGALDSDPIIVNNDVYVASSKGNVYGINLATGAQDWTASVGAPAQFTNGPTVGLGAGEGYLLVPATNTLTAFTSAVSGATVRPAGLTFAPQNVGTTSGSQAVTITNTGTVPLTVNSGTIVVNGTNASDFAETNNCGASLAPQASCTANVTFAPSATGSRSAALDVFTSPGATPTAATQLSGTGTAPAVSVSASSLSFGSTTVGSTSPSQSVTISNTGTGTLAFGTPGVSVTGANPSDFVESTGCGSTLVPGASCTAVVSFAPTAQGSRSATLALSDNAANSPQGVALQGTGVAADVGVGLTAPSTARNGSTVTYTVSVTNNGPGAAAGVTVTDALPTGLLFAATNGPGCATPAKGANGTVTCAMGSLPAGTGTTFSITATVNAPKNTTLVNTGRVSASTLDSNSSNNSATTSTLVTNK